MSSWENLGLHLGRSTLLIFPGRKREVSWMQHFTKTRKFLGKPGGIGHPSPSPDVEGKADFQETKMKRSGTSVLAGAFGLFFFPK